MPESPGTLAEALIRLQATLPRITKDDEAQVGTRTYRYANLASIHDAVFPLLAPCGLAWVCKPTLTEAGRFVMRYTMTHAPSREADSGDYPLPDSTPQAQGGAITYARRYALCAYVGIAPVEDDDDAQAAEHQARASYEARVAAGRMSREQMREHGQLERDVKSSPRKAERITGPASGDPWAAPPPEDNAGSSSKAQHVAMRTLFAKLRITTHDDRMLAIGSMLDIDPPGTTEILSYNQAAEMMRKLQKMISEEGK